MNAMGLKLTGPVIRLDFASRDLAIKQPWNPNGWLVRARDTLVDFGADTLAIIDHGIAYGQSLRARMVVFWDIEGQAYDEGIAGRPMYVGDPVIGLRGPMLRSIVREAVRRVAAAGMLVAFTFRHTRLCVCDDGHAEQVYCGDPADSLIDNIQRARWNYDPAGEIIRGAYWDSNHPVKGDGTKGVPAQVLAKITGEFGNLFLFPEHYAPDYELVDGVYPLRVAGKPERPFPELVLPSGKDGNASATERAQWRRDFTVKNGDIPCLTGNAYPDGPAPWNGPLLAAWTAAQGAK